MRFISNTMVAARSLAIIALLVVTLSAEVGRIAQPTIRSVSKIHSIRSNSSTYRIGSGFTVNAKVQRGTTNYQFRVLITNKHVVGDWTVADGDIADYFDALEVFFYMNETNTTKRFSPLAVPIKNTTTGSCNWRVQLHPNPQVDVVAIFIEDILTPESGVWTSNWTTNSFVPFDAMNTNHIGLGEQVFALGYPHNITSLNNNYPVAKSGYIASQPGEELSINIFDQNRNKTMVPVQLSGKIILIDGLITHGNSGGPVIMPQETVVNTAGDNATSTFTRFGNQLVGIVSRSTADPGLSVIYGTDYILDVINAMTERTTLNGKNIEIKHH